MVYMDPTDKKLSAITLVLFIVSGIFFVGMPDKGLFFYLFGAVLLLIVTLTCIVMAGLAYSIGRETENVKIAGKDGLINQFCNMSDKDGNFLIGVIVILLAMILASNMFTHFVQL